MVSDLIPKNHGIVMALKKSREENPTFDKWASSHRKAFENALKIENLNKNTGIHPSGIAICSEIIGDVIPLQKTKEGAIVSGYDMDDVSDLMVKFDILGLRTLTIADNTCRKLGIELSEIDHNDPFIYQVLQNFRHPVGLFQISADTNFRVCQQVKPDSLHELSDVIGLARPATLQFISEYVEQKKNPKKLGINDELDEILQDTKNVMLFQENMMFAASKVFGMSLEEAESLRRVVGKKKVDEIPAWKDKIYKAAEAKGLTQEVADYFWAFVEAAGNYSFNKCLSPDSIVETREGDKCLFELNIGEEILAFDVKTETNHWVKVLDKIESKAELHEVEFDDGRKIVCSLEHKFLCGDKKMRSLKEILEQGFDIVCID